MMRLKVSFVRYTQQIFENDLTALPAFAQHVNLCRPIYRNAPKAMVAVVAFTFLVASKRIKSEFYHFWMNKRLIAFCQSAGFSSDEYLPPVEADKNFRSLR